MLRHARSLACKALRTAADVVPARDFLPVRLARWIWTSAADVIDPGDWPPSASPVYEAPTSRAAPSEPAPPPEHEIEPGPLVELIGGDRPPLVVDVREPIETQGGVIPGARLVPMREVLQRIGELREDGRKVVVYCATGNRSARVALQLRDRGVDALSLAGGIAAWAGVGGDIGPA